MFIIDVPVADLATIVAGLVREAVCFKATVSDTDGKFYTIELTGGY